MKKYMYIIIGSILLVDQLSKILISNLMSVGNEINIIKNFLYLTYVKNTGAAWSILEGQQLPLIILTSIVLIVLIKIINTNKVTKYELLGYFLMVGGILGNLMDRIFNGYVIDFIGMYIFDYAFPIFNISDIAIVLGASMLIIDAAKGAKK